MTPPEAHAVVEAVLGPLSDLPELEARAQAEASRSLVFSDVAMARAQGFALLEACGDWPTLSLLAERVDLSAEGEVRVSGGPWPWSALCCCTQDRAAVSVKSSSRAT